MPLPLLSYTTARRSCASSYGPFTMPPPLSSTAFAAASTFAVLIPTTTCPGMGWSTAVASASVTGPPARAAKVGSVAKLQRHSQDLAVKPDRFVQVVRRQHDHPYLVSLMVASCCGLRYQREFFRPARRLAKAS